MDPEDGAGVLVYGLLVVGEPGAVRGTDLPEPRAGELEHLRDAEAAPDLDELAARDDHLRRVSDHGREREQGRPRAVVDDQGILGAGQLLEERHRVVVARTAGAGGQIVLQVRVVPGGFGDRSDRTERPRLVWRMTPVALTTRRRPLPVRSREAAVATVSSEVSGSSPAVISRRRRSNTSRTAAVATVCPWRPASALPAGPRNTASTAGRPRRRSFFPASSIRS